MIYLESCKAACKWCAEGIARRGKDHFNHHNMWVGSCTAPTQEQFIEQQAARVGELENRVRQAEEEAQRAKWDHDTMFANLQEWMDKSSKQAARIAQLEAEREQLVAAAKAKLKDCREIGDCSDAALQPGEYCSNECAALATAVAKASEAPTPEQLIEELDAEIRALEAERNLIASQANRLNDELNTLRKQLDDERFVSQNLQRTIDVIAKEEHTNAEHRKLLRSVLDRERDSLRQRVSALEAEREQQDARIVELGAENKHVHALAAAIAKAKAEQR